MVPVVEVHENKHIQCVVVIGFVSRSIVHELSNNVLL